MRILIDTNILISAFVFGGLPFAVLGKLRTHDCTLIVSGYVYAEFERILLRKWPSKYAAACNLLRGFAFEFCPSANAPVDVPLRDPNDEPVLADAIHCHADMILTGDKDLLQANIAKPIVMTPAAVMLMMEGAG